MAVMVVVPQRNVMSIPSIVMRVSQSTLISLSIPRDVSPGIVCVIVYPRPPRPPLSPAISAGRLAVLRSRRH